MNVQIGNKVQVIPGGAGAQLELAQRINKDPDAKVVAKAPNGITCSVRTKLAEYCVYCDWLTPAGNIDTVNLDGYSETYVIRQQCFAFSLRTEVDLRPEDVNESGFVLAKVATGGKQHLAVVHASWLQPTDVESSPIRTMGKWRCGQEVAVNDDDFVPLVDRSARRLICTIQRFDFAGTTLYAHCQFASGLIAPVPLYKLRELGDV